MRRDKTFKYTVIQPFVKLKFCHYFKSVQTFL